MLKSKVIITRPEAMERELNEFFIRIRQMITEIKDIEIINISSDNKSDRMMVTILYEYYDIDQNSIDPQEMIETLKNVPKPTMRKIGERI